MKNIFNSASKIVFILMALAVVGLTFMNKVDPKDFMMLSGMVFSYYFSRQNVDKSSVVTP